MLPSGSRAARAGRVQVQIRSRAKSRLRLVSSRAGHRAPQSSSTDNAALRPCGAHPRPVLAWFIARRPGGSIAGAIAYRHHSVQMFEGYAGTSASGFRAEVEAERALERGEHLLLMVERHEHHHLTGPAAAEARARVEEFGRHAGFAGIISTDRRQMLKLLSRHEPHVYPGALVTCVHNPDRALCTGGRKSPSLIDCQPLACRNAAFSAQNTAAWQIQLSAIDRELAEAALPPYVAHRLAERRGQIGAVTGDEREQER